MPDRAYIGADRKDMHRKLGLLRNELDRRLVLGHENEPSLRMSLTSGVLSPSRTEEKF